VFIRKETISVLSTCAVIGCLQQNGNIFSFVREFDGTFKTYFLGKYSRFLEFKNKKLLKDTDESTKTTQISMTIVLINNYAHITLHKTRAPNLIVK